jgi:UDP-N-acetylmuramoyl-L-alanyl-D-glutamate--2,6-diaminopimelate ligase
VLALRLQQIAERFAVCELIGDGGTEITGMQMDNRKVKPGDLFFCVQGARFDGHSFAAQAAQAGAVALVVERRLDIDLPQLIVKKVRDAIPVAASHFFGYPSNSLQVIGITGTNGKTTTSYILEKMIADAGYRTGLMGNISIKIGDVTVPNIETNTRESVDLQRTLSEMKEAAVDYCVMEVTSNGLVMGRVVGCRFRTAIFTNLTQDHLEHHGTMENYKAAKGLLFSRLGNAYAADPSSMQFAVLNADDPASAYYSGQTTAQVITYGVSADADVKASNIRVTARGTEFECATFAGSVSIRMKLVGKFNVYNALAAISAALAEGIPLEALKASLEQMDVVEGRMEVVDAGQPFLVLVDYAHTPDGLDNALSTIKELAERRIITVFGCGGDRDRTKRAPMGKVVANYSDYVIVTSDNPRTEDPEAILRDIVPGLAEAGLPEDRYELIADRRSAIKKAIDLVSPDDVVLIAGKGHETYQEVMGVKHDFDDRIVAREAILDAKR